MEKGVATHREERIISSVREGGRGPAPLPDTWTIGGIIMAKEVQMSAEAKRLIDVLKAHKGEAKTLSELAQEAGIPNKSGYLTAVKKALGESLVVTEGGATVEVVVKKKVNTYTYKGE